MIEALYVALKSGDPGGFVGNPMQGTKTLVDCSIDYISVARAIIDALEKNGFTAGLKAEMNIRAAFLICSKLSRLIS